MVVVLMDLEIVVAPTVGRVVGDVGEGGFGCSE